MRIITSSVLKLIFGMSLILIHEAQGESATFENKYAILDAEIALWTNKQEIDRRLQRIKEAGFNVYMPAIWYGRGTTWPSDHAPWDFTLRADVTQGSDPLRYAIEKAHEHGLEVHPWFTLALRWNESFMPQYGLEGVKEGPQSAFDVHNPSYREFITRIIREVVTKYDIDGINLDYGRAMGLCTSSACQEEYRLLYNRNLSVDTLVFKLSPQKVPTLIEYQEIAVTGLIQSISHHVRKIKPSILITADAHPELTRYEQGQNSVDWVNRGLVDIVFQMDYHPTINFEAAERVRARLSNPNAQCLLISNMSIGADLRPNEKPHARSGQWIAETIATILERRPDSGIAVYFYKYLTDEQIKALRTGPFSDRMRKKVVSPPANLQVQ